LHILDLQNVEKVYVSGAQQVAALRGVSLAAGRGEFVAVTGPSGCGKSTLLHLIGGMDRPTRGTVKLDGIDLGSFNEEELTRIRRREIGFVFQFFNLLPTLSVAENVSLPLALDGRSERVARMLAAELLDRVGLSGRAGHYPSQLSGGEMQRAAVARALVAGPKLVLADEPTGNLDSENGRQVIELLAGLNRELSVTIVLATHSPEAASAAKRIIRLRDGAIEPVSADGPVSQTV
jgi:putative ABC transport system ATP-binding protein